MTIVLVRVARHTSDTRAWPMQPVVFTDLAETDAQVCDEVDFDNEDLEALTEDLISLPDDLDTDMLCLDVFYAVVGCGIAYVMVS